MRGYELEGGRRQKVLQLPFGQDHVILRNILLCNMENLIQLDHALLCLAAGGVVRSQHAVAQQTTGCLRRFGGYDWPACLHYKRGTGVLGVLGKVVWAVASVACAVASVAWAVASVDLAVAA